MKTTFRTVAAAALLAGTAFTPALAQSAPGYVDPSHYDILNGPTGYEAGNILVHLSVIGVLPEDVSSHVNVHNGPTLSGYNVHASDGISPELDASYFITKNLSLQLIAATSRHTLSINNGGVAQTLGSAWVLPPTLTAQWHFPQIGIIRPYIGAGITVAFFYGISPKNGDALGLRTAVGPAADIGFDIPLSGNWTANVDVKQMFLPVSARINHGAVRANDGLDPTVVGFGVGYKF
ncbi:OmpW/AlkL family protein [Acidocella aromatica]|uniref:Outer membrane protein n=1 Tax=Acidocella aromatica TaxID=1303579 RepID=A0A840VJ84_9PROT|nr:OmpW family outer membrane protein [Acidocella aromatica]MBB5372319.1 outer membrane protein [Acidocella aromatica]